MKIVLDDGAFMPVRAHKTDAGLDLRSKEDFKLWPGSSYSTDIGVHFDIPKGYFGKIESKSGLNVKKGIVCCGGVVDAGYTGSVVVKLYNLGDVAHHFKPGDKLAQIVFLPIVTPELEVVDSLEKTERGENGFGSSGR